LPHSYFVASFEGSGEVTHPPPVDDSTYSSIGLAFRIRSPGVS
jgi:hypothetical protein